MKKKYFVHRQDAQLEADTIIYVLWCGESVREQRILTKIMAWAFAQHATVTSWCEAIDYYLDYESDRVFPGRGLLDFGFIQREITASEFLQHIEADDWEAYEASPDLPKNYIGQIRLCDPSRLGTIIQKNVLPCVSAKRRKNLSDSNRDLVNLIPFV